MVPTGIQANTPVSLNPVNDRRMTRLPSWSRVPVVHCFAEDWFREAFWHWGLANQNCHKPEFGIGHAATGILEEKGEEKWLPTYSIYQSKLSFLTYRQIKCRYPAK